MSYKKIGLGALIILIICLVVCSCGCVSSDNSSTSSTPPTPTINYTTVCCPNPSCPLHDPNGYVSSSGGGVTPLVNSTSCYRPIGIQTSYIFDRAGDIIGIHHTYLCQVCGAEWSD